MTSADALLASLPAGPQAHPILTDMQSSGGRPHEMTTPQLSTLRSHLERDYWAFAYTVGGCDVLHRPLHGPVCELMEKWGEPGWQRLMVQLPRGALKSTLCTRTGALWRIVKDPDTTVVIFNEKIERVEKWLVAIQSIVAGNPLFQALWPEIIPPGIAKGDPRSVPKQWKWSAREMMFVRSKTGIPEASITAMSVGGASAGGHWEWHFWDDLISVEAQNSKVVMQAAKDWSDTAIYLGLSPESLNAWVSCTRWHYDDVYEHLRKYHNFKLYRRAAIEDGETSFPRSPATKGLGWTTDELKKMQERRPSSFSAQMQNQPMASENPDFDPAKLKRCVLVKDDWGNDCVRWLDYDPNITLIEEEPPQEVPLSQIAKVLLVDPAPSSDTERKQEPDARTAMVMRGCDAWGRRYILDVWAGREGPEAELRRVLDTCEEWGCGRWGCEEVNFSKLYAPFLRYIIQQERREPLGYVPLKPGRREKGVRIKGFANSIANGFEGCLETCRHTLLEEMIPYPLGRTVDILDAASYDRDEGVLGRPESPDEEGERHHRDTLGGHESGRDPYTGY